MFFILMCKKKNSIFQILSKLLEMNPNQHFFVSNVLLACFSRNIYSFHYTIIFIQITRKGVYKNSNMVGKNVCKRMRATLKLVLFKQIIFLWFYYIAALRKKGKERSFHWSLTIYPFVAPLLNYRRRKYFTFILHYLFFHYFFFSSINY